MKTKLMLVCGLLALVALSTAKPAQDEYEYEDEPAPPPKKATARPLVGRRNPLAGKKPASTTTTTTAAPEEEAEGEPAEGDYVDEQVPETSSTTETSKKFIKSGVVRPFRSNDDLLATLKRRREQVVSNKQLNKAAASSSDPKEDSASEPPKKESKPASTSGRRNRFSKPAKAATSNEVPGEEPSSTSATARAGRARFSARS